ncbi:hypothetical protein BJN42_26560 [Pseudomonas koreensis]|jgi:hypothetical protein|nr:hypothetical protein BJN42_26560 [Pseudomonas koreensis]
MVIHYAANTLPGTLYLSDSFVLFCSAEGLAELATADHWREHAQDTPCDITIVHLSDVAGRDEGLFEVRRQLQPIYTATRLYQG